MIQKVDLRTRAATRTTETQVFVLLETIISGCNSLDELKQQYNEQVPTIIRHGYFQAKDTYQIFDGVEKGTLALWKINEVYKTKQKLLAIFWDDGKPHPDPFAGTVFAADYKP